jgi:BirA family biotin operon repressor/biotin-[acetyl-CoA-carboxylase] ligase
VTPTEAPPFIARRQRFEQVGSTNDVVGSWLRAGEPEVCLAVADEQTAGRGRDGRSWTAPAGRALLLSLGFRPTWLEPGRVWQLAASVGVAMAEAAEQISDLAAGTVRLKWPNDLVVEAGSDVRKIAGVLGETDGLGSAHPIAVVGIGINADWDAAEFPAELAGSMTSLREVAGRPVDRDRLLEAFLTRLDVRLRSLRLGSFDALGWSGRQVTTGRLIRIEGSAGAASVVRAVRTDALSGALVVADPDDAARTREIYSGDVVHVRLEPAGGRV